MTVEKIGTIITEIEDQEIVKGKETTRIGRAEIEITTTISAAVEVEVITIEGLVVKVTVIVIEIGIIRIEVKGE